MLSVSSFGVRIVLQVFLCCTPSPRTWEEDVTTLLGDLVQTNPMKRLFLTADLRCSQTSLIPFSLLVLASQRRPSYFLSVDIKMVCLKAWSPSSLLHTPPGQRKESWQNYTKHLGTVNHIYHQWGKLLCHAQILKIRDPKTKRCHSHKWLLLICQKLILSFK